MTPSSSRGIPAGCRAAVGSGLVFGAVEPGQSPERLLVFLPGFLQPPSAYHHLLADCAGHGTMVVAARLYRPGPSALLGRFTVDDETQRAVALSLTLIDELTPQEFWIGGHSRGGQVAWLAAGRLHPSVHGVVAIDPVDGAGPRSSTPHATAAPAQFRARTLVIGGRGGRCAPLAGNHERFVANAPPDTCHIMLPALGHGDVLESGRARLGRLLCGGAGKPAVNRASVATTVHQFMTASGRPSGRAP